jgi:hypothetical protein
MTVPVPCVVCNAFNFYILFVHLSCITDYIRYDKTNQQMPYEYSTYKMDTCMLAYTSSTIMLGYCAYVTSTVDVNVPRTIIDNINVIVLVLLLLLYVTFPRD